MFEFEPFKKEESKKRFDITKYVGYTAVFLAGVVLFAILSTGKHHYDQYQRDQAELDMMRFMDIKCKSMETDLKIMTKEDFEDAKILPQYWHCISRNYIHELVDSKLELSK